MKSKIVFGVGLLIMFVAFFFFPQANALAPHTQEECVMHAKIGYVTGLAKEKEYPFQVLVAMFDEHYNNTTELQAYGTLEEFHVVLTLAYYYVGTAEEAAGFIYNRCIAHEDLA